MNPEFSRSFPRGTAASNQRGARWAAPLALSLLMAARAAAQMSTLPPTIGQAIDLYGTTADWAAQINALAGVTPGDRPIEPLASADGINMGGAAPGVAGDVIGVRVIYFGSSSAADIDFGASLGGPVAGARTSFRGAAAAAPTVAGTMLAGVADGATSFTFWDLPVGGGSFGGFDIWLNVEGASGGLFHAFHPEWDVASGATGPQSYWSQPFTLNTRQFDPTSTSVQARAVTTYLLTFDDAQDDDDRSDLILGVQFLRKEGRTDIVAAVPEPAEMGLAGTAVLGAFVATRCASRRRRP